MRSPQIADTTARRVAIYVRASRLFANRPGLTIEQQEADCREYAARNDWAVAEVYQDLSKSAYKDQLGKRPAFQQMIADARDGKFDVVLVYKLDRFARRVGVQYQAAAELERCKVQIASVTEPLDLATAAGKMTFGMLAVAAEAYSALHGERMRSIRAAEARNGKLTGPPPYGLIRTNGKIHHHPHDAPVVLRIFQLRAGGYSLQRIARKLREDGVMFDGREFASHDVKRILGQCAYTALVTCGGETFEGTFAPIVPRQLWDEVRSLMAATHRNRRARSSRTDVATLGGIGYCANCGARLHFQQDKRRGYRHYYCYGRKEGSHCNARWCHAAALEKSVLDLVRQIGELPGQWYEDTMEHVEHRAAAATPSTTTQADIEEKLRRLGRAYADGAFTEAEYDARRKQLLAKRDAAPPAVPKPDIAVAAEHLRDIAGLIDLATDEERQALLHVLFSQVFARNNELYAVRPTQLFASLLVKYAGNCSDKGNGYPPRSIIPVILPLHSP